MYASFFMALLLGRIDCSTDTFRVMLVADGYQPDFGTDARRSDVVAYEAAGRGYTAGGAKVTTALTQDEGRVFVALGSAHWDPSTLKATGAIYYKSRGGDALNDELVGYVDFGDEFISDEGIFHIAGSKLEFGE
jgi:hypothetical protein